MNFTKLLALASPRKIVLSVLFTVCLINSGIIYYLLGLPHTGIEFEVVDHQVVVSTEPEHNTGLRAGDVIVALSSEQDKFLIEETDLLEEPDIFQLYSDYNRFMKRQSELAKLLTYPRLNLHLSNSTVVDISLQKTHWSDLPLLFWLQMLVANVSILAGASVWAFRRSDRSAIHYAWIGVFLAMTIWPAAIYSSRELAIEGEMFRYLSAANHLGSFMTMAAVLSLLWNYSKPLWNIPFDRLVYAAFFLNWLADFNQWSPDLDTSTRIPALLAIILCIILLLIHWFRSKGDVLYRQSIKWFLMVIVLGCGSFVAVQMIPPLFDSSPMVSQGLSFVAFLSIYLGLAIGVMQFNLFELDRWWFEVWSWIGIGIVLIAFDFLFISLFSLSEKNALWIALAITGWAYFPLRQWLFNKYLSKENFDFNAYLPKMVQVIAKARSAQDLYVGCRKSLLEIYSPLTYKLLSSYESEIKIDNHGLFLLIPFERENKTLRLECADKGQRLFGSSDVKTATALVRLFDQAWLASKTKDDAIKSERERIKQDIHDTLGGRLLSIMRHKSNPEVAAIATAAWRELRDILAAMEGKRERLVSVLDHWFKDSKQIVASDHVALDWQVSDNVRNEMIILLGHERMHLGQILRESMTNAIRHSETDYIKVKFELDRNALVLTVENNGLSSSPDRWQASRGLHHIRRRAGELGATVEWKDVGEKTVRFKLNMLLQDRVL